MFFDLSNKIFASNIFSSFSLDENEGGFMSDFSYSPPKGGVRGGSLLKLIQQGEHQTQDFKYCISDSRKIARSLVAFANTDGGRLLVGVKDNGRIAGLRSEEEYYSINESFDRKKMGQPVSRLSPI
jgi:hypothetical protein